MNTAYSTTPLAKKLGLNDGGELAAIDAPAGFEQWLAPLPLGASVTCKRKKKFTLRTLFCANRAVLNKGLPKVSRHLHSDGALWISWPKKTSTLFIDLTEDGIREIVLPTGLVDIKVCAVNEDWSSLKLMVRKELGGSWYC